MSTHPDLVKTVEIYNELKAEFAKEAPDAGEVKGCIMHLAMEVLVIGGDYNKVRFDYLTKANAGEFSICEEIDEELKVAGIQLDGGSTRGEIVRLVRLLGGRIPDAVLEDANRERPRGFAQDLFEGRGQLPID